MPEVGFELSFDLDVARRPEDVFAYLVDASHFKDLDDALVDYGPPDDLHAGSTGWFRHRRGGMTANTTFTVTAFDAPRHLTVAIAGMGYEMTEAATLVSTPSGTRATFVDRVWPTSLAGRLLVALSGGIMRRDLAKRAALLAAALERPTQGSTIPTGPARRDVVVAGLVVGTIWAIGGPILLSGDPFNPDFGQTVMFSVMQASFAAVAWLIVRIAGGDRPIVAAAWFVGAASLLGAVGNFIEDGLRMTDLGSTIYFFGLVGLLIGLIVLAITLAFRHRRALAGVMLLSVVGLVLAMGRVPIVLPVVWLSLAAWAASGHSLAALQK